MPNAFEEEEVDSREAEFAETPEENLLSLEPTEAQVEESLSEATASEQTSIDALDLECEKRFEIAIYYRTLLKGRLFNEDNEASKIVETEARAFFKERLEVLLGIRAPQAAAPMPQPLPFDQEEIAALKAVARRLVRKPELIEAHPAQPVLRRASIPAPVPQPVMPPRSAQPKPTVKKPAVAAGPKPAKVTYIPPKENGIVKDTGKIIEKDGKRYKVAVNDLGTAFKQDITGQGNPATRLPMPTGAMLGQATEMAATRQISKLDIEVNGHHVGVQDLANKVSQE